MASHRIPKVLFAVLLVGLILLIVTITEYQQQQQQNLDQATNKNKPSGISITPKKVTEPQLSGSKELCQQLSDPEFHRRHGFTKELERLDRHYALTEDVIKSGWIRGEVQDQWVQKIVTAKEPLTILAMGGSFTRGHGCGETRDEREKEDCSWPARLQRWWESHFSQNGMIHPVPHLIHMGEHGTGSVNAIQQMGAIVQSLDHKPDIIIIDYLVNDVFFDDQEGYLAFENLIRIIRDLLPSTQILILEAGCKHCLERIHVLHRRRQVARFYNIPTVDYAAMVQLHNKNPLNVGPDLLWPMEPPLLEGGGTVIGAPWPNFIPAVTVTQRTCCAENHPPWPVHQYVADSIAYAILQMLSQKVQCNADGTSSFVRDHESFHSQEELDRYPSCREPLSYHDAQTAPVGIHTNNSTGWSLYEDKPGRPGWISSKTGSTLYVPLQFGDQPMLAITFLRSYANVGSARITLRSLQQPNEHEEEYLHAHWEKNVSLTYTAFFPYISYFYQPLENDGWGSQSSLKPIWKKGEEGKIYNLEITFDRGSKFKVTRVVSC